MKTVVRPNTNFNPRSPMESDITYGGATQFDDDFNPRSPMESDMTRLFFTLLARVFQSTLSYGERQQKYVKKTSKIYLFINFTTLSKVSLVVYFIYFLFTTFLEFFLGANLLRFFCVL